MNIKNKKLYRSSENKILFGVLGGIGEYLEVDPALVRASSYFFLCLYSFGHQL
jgi:phage shock protein PspC (stress-responsive transcriptional regulator)